MFCCQRFQKHLWIIGGAVLFFLLAGGMMWWIFHPQPLPKFGITFSSAYARELGLSPEEVFSALAKEENVRFARIPLYWNHIEQEEGQYDWKEMDALLAIAEDYDMKITLVIGQKVPRWPECHIPSWALSLPDHERWESFSIYVQQAITRYKNSPALVRWQVENEPLFDYGVCPTIDSENLQETLALVRAQDDHPIQLTVSGELEFWWPLARMSDVLGFSLYQVTWSDTTGYFVYPISPLFYRLRVLAASFWTDQVVVSELQAEPWFTMSLGDRPLEEWYGLFDEKALRDRVHFSEEIGVSEVYLWGAEWWYYLKVHGFDGLWNEAGKIFGGQTD